jgi:hypothetical protein
MGYKKLSKEQELQLVEEYRKGTPVVELMAKYGYKTKKSITDKVKKYYPDEYKNIVKEAQSGRRGYTYSLSELTSPFDAYLVGLLLTDGYVLSDRDGLGLDMTDEDVIAFVANTIGTKYTSYDIENKKTHYRVLIAIPGISAEVERFGIVQRKSNIVPEPQLMEKERRFLPYIIRGIIDGDGSVAKTSYGGSQFFIVTKSEMFANWIKKVLENDFFMDDVSIRISNEGLYRIETANQYNILKLIALVYNKPFGMNRKYNNLRKTFRDYNNDALLDKDDGIVQTTTD